MFSGRLVGRAVWWIGALLVAIGVLGLPTHTVWAMSSRDMEITRSPPGTRRTCRTGRPEAVHNLIKRVKRVAFGFRRFTHYRIRALLYAGKPNWDLLATITLG